MTLHITKSKRLFQAHIQPLLDAGMTRAEVARALGFDNPNNVTMLLSDGYPTLLSLNRLPQLARLCHMSDLDVGKFMLARIEDGVSRPFELSRETLEWCLPGLNAAVAAAGAV